MGTFNYTITYKDGYMQSSGEWGVGAITNILKSILENPGLMVEIESITIKEDVD